MNKVKLFIISSLLVIFSVLNFSCNFFETNQLVNDEFKEKKNDNIITEKDGPFSKLRHKYIDEAILYEEEKSNTPRNLLQSQKEMTLEEKMILLTSLRTKSISRAIEDAEQDDIYYKQLSEQLLTDADGMILISTEPIEIENNQNSEFRSPLIQEVN